MIETLESRTDLSSQQGPVDIALTITSIYFEGGDLSQARYPSLIDYSRAPAWVQFEPCLQIRSNLEPLTIRFEIDPKTGVSFAPHPIHPGQVKISPLLNPQELDPHYVSAKLVDGDPTKCDLVWSQSIADNEGLSWLNTIRLFCQKAGSLTALEEVEGGLYLAILNRDEEPFHLHHHKHPGEPVPGTIKMLGFDLLGRPRYDLFHPHDFLPEPLILEPAFRCREGQIVTFSLALDLPEEIPLMFLTEPPPNDNQVAVTGFLPAGHPFQLYETTVGRFDGHERRNCTMTWTQETGRQYCATSNPEEAKRCYCILGQSSSFSLRATEDGQLASEPRKRADFDPTVIQPPSCTSSGICITP